MTADDEVRMIAAVSPLRERLATNFRGEYAVTRVVLRAMEKGWTPLRPLIECRYDLMLDDGIKAYRAQVKYAGGKAPKQANGVVPVGLKKWRSDGRPPIRYYTAAEVDVVLVYVRAIDQILWFGPEIFAGKTMLQIRIEPTRNGQRKGCLMAADHIW